MADAKKVIAETVYDEIMPLEDADFIADAILAALSAAGLVVVPKEPTEAMLIAMHHEIDWYRNEQNTFFIEHGSQVGTTCKRDLQDAYRAMIAATPTTGGDNG